MAAAPTALELRIGSKVDFSRILEWVVLVYEFVNVQKDVVLLILALLGLLSTRILLDASLQTP